MTSTMYAEIVKLKNVKKKHEQHSSLHCCDYSPILHKCCSRYRQAYKTTKGMTECNKLQS